MVCSACLCDGAAGGSECLRGRAGNRLGTAGILICPLPRGKSRSPGYLTVGRRVQRTLEEHPSTGAAPHSRVRPMEMGRPSAGPPVNGNSAKIIKTERENREHVGSGCWRMAAAHSAIWPNTAESGPLALPPFSFPPTLFVYGNGGTRRSVAREDPDAIPQRDRMPITPPAPNELYADGGSLESRQCP